MQIRSRNSIKIEIESHKKLVRNCSKNDGKLNKIVLWGCLGALWGLPWRQGGPRPATRARILEKYWFLRFPGGSKMEPKSSKNMGKNLHDFRNDFEAVFSWSWDDFGSKKLSTMTGLRVILSTSLRICEKCDFEQPSIVLSIFFQLWEHRFSTLKGIIVSCFFKGAFQTYFFAFWVEVCSKFETKWDQKSKKNHLDFKLKLRWIFKGF